ncbi:MAG: SIMPL domain-containing protein [Clostridia bacterium]|nr:SIMPL domain-containing protein [Clostridia bacterium]
MDIYVNATGKKFYKPNQITLTFDFNYKSNDYETALSGGVENVTKYVSFLQQQGFNKEDIKTLSFRVSENKIYNEATRKYYPDGFLFQQKANLVFDYDIKKLSTLMEETSKLDTPPVYFIRFNLKNDKSAEEEILALAYKEAEFQAQAIAKASGKQLKECVKVSFTPFESALTSPTLYEADRCCAKAASFGSAREQIQQTFVPEDILVSKEIYCLFVAQ